MTTIKKYSKEFKADAVSLVIEQGYTRSETAKSLEFHTNVLGRWVRKYQEGSAHEFRDNGKLMPDQKEVRKLKAQVRRLQMEKEVI